MSGKSRAMGRSAHSWVGQTHWRSAVEISVDEATHSLAGEHGTLHVLGALAQRRFPDIDGFSALAIAPTCPFPFVTGGVPDWNADHVRRIEVRPFTPGRSSCLKPSRTRP